MLEMSTMELLGQVYPQHTVYGPASLPSPSPDPCDQGFLGFKAPLQTFTTPYLTPIAVPSAKRRQTSDLSCGSHTKKPKISQASPRTNSIDLSSISILPKLDAQTDPSDSATISENQPQADTQPTSVLEPKTLEESVASAFEYSNNLVLLDEKKFPVPMGGDINSFLKFKRAEPNSEGKAHILTYPQRPMPASWNAAVQKRPDRTLLAFYWFAFCTGRSLIPATNPWNDFVTFHSSPGIRCAILCLAAVHLHDHVPDKQDGGRVIRNNRFGYRAIQLHKRAVAYLRKLLDCKEDESSSEVISLLIILSTIDTLRIEYRNESPSEPTWYQGFRLAEKYLDKRGENLRFWEEECWNKKIPKSLSDTLPIGFGEFQPMRHQNSQPTSPRDSQPTNPMETQPTSSQHSQPTSLHICQSVLVARGIILAQVMTKLPQPKNFVPMQESRRFGWLLQASSENVWTIHGGCGVWPKLLHIVSQINYCATRLNQDEQSVVVPITARKILRLLYELRPTRLAEAIIDPATKTIERTAYAWLLTAIIYLRCRVQRYPPSHRYVRKHLDDLAKCIQAVPASGPHFTANAPILPVFLLGLLSTKHKEVAQGWFEKVLQVPVRSTVPPIYKALKRTWEWKRIWPSAKKVPYLIREREPWWEKLVDRLLIEAGGMLCFA
ncbi:fungal-specific transcription factor domain-containing protein [Dactylonectria estremocensis]|uniref:Fungal-specific transcription factor domain-containing protein n=1 Tax=Dactylonectria estremocensis TaxID=1079267 RepID=A0A9P9IFZ3_9HYPO|nr:fungal-specific transcription factor domain-containing protein [Dactylonectria estremocensis]